MQITDLNKGCVQALGNAFGSFNSAPYVVLDGDDRIGACVTGKNLRINGNMAYKIKKLLIYTFIYEGAAYWKTAKGVVTVKSSGARDIIVNMDEYGSTKIMCAIALIEKSTDKDFSVEKVVRFFNGHKDRDNALK